MKYKKFPNQPNLLLEYFGFCLCRLFSFIEESNTFSWFSPKLARSPPPLATERTKDRGTFHNFSWLCGPVQEIRMAFWKLYILRVPYSFGSVALAWWDKMFLVTTERIEQTDPSLCIPCSYSLFFIGLFLTRSREARKWGRLCPKTFSRSICPGRLRFGARSCCCCYTAAK